jgi:hypothetical protein
MKLVASNTHIEKGGQQFRELPFGIGNLGVVMKILREMMYSDPIRAICREITCNGRDAHREAGIPTRPIQIHLPHKLDKHWRAKDWGLGISPDRVGSVFVWYGESTKRGDNVQTGGFGLGAKTPFARTNQFTIITTTEEDGVRTKRTYIAHIDEKDTGTLRLVFEAITDEPCGTEIVVPVEDKDFEAYANATMEATYYWDDVPDSIRPVIVGADPLPQYEARSDKVLRGENWAIEADTSRQSYWDSRAKAILDGMPYPISLNNFNDLTDKDRHLLAKKLLLYFDIGELTPSANREHLQYDDLTKKKIKERIEALRTEVAKHLTDSIAAKTSYWDATIFYNDFVDTLSPALPGGYAPLWNGNDISRTEIPVPLLGQQQRDLFRVDIFGINTVAISTDEVALRKQQSKALEIRDGNTIFINDLTSYRVSRTRIKKIIAEENVKTVQVISFPNGNEQAALDFWKKDKTNGRASAFDLDLLNIRRLSSIIVPKQEKKADAPAKLRRGKRSDFDAFIFNENYYGKRKSDNFWDPCLLLKNGGTGVYVVLRGVGKACAYNNEHLKIIQHVLGEDVCIFGIKDSDTKYLGKNFVPLSEEIRKAAEEIKQDVDIEQIKVDLNVERLPYELEQFLSGHIADIPPGSPIVDYFAEQKRINSSRAENQTLLHFLKIDDKDFSTETKAKSKLTLLTHEIFKRYPLLVLINTWQLRHREFKIIKDYLCAMDEKALDISNEVVMLEDATG